MFLDHFASIKGNFHSRSCHRPTSKRRLSFFVSRYSNWASTSFALAWAKKFLTQKLPFCWNTHFRGFLEACLTQFQLLGNASLSNMTGGSACPYPATCERARRVVKPKILAVAVGFAVGPLAEVKCHGVAPVGYRGSRCSTRCLLQISPLPPMLKRIPLIMKPTTSATSATSLRNTDRRQCLDMVDPHDSTLRKTQCADTLAIRARPLASGRVARTICGSVCPDDFPGLRLLGHSPTTCGKQAESFRSLPSAQIALLEVSLIISVIDTTSTNATATNYITTIVAYAVVSMMLLSFLV